MNKFQMSLVREGNKDLIKFDKQIADLEQKAIKAVLPFKKKIDDLKEQRKGLIEFLEKFKVPEQTDCVSPVSTGTNPNTTVESVNTVSHDADSANINILEDENQ